MGGQDSWENHRGQKDLTCLLRDNSNVYSPDRRTTRSWLTRVTNPLELWFVLSIHRAMKVCELSIVQGAIIPWNFPRMFIQFTFSGRITT